MEDTLNFFCVVYVDDNGELCMCNIEFKKTCKRRLIGDLDCRESSVRVTPIQITDDSQIIFSSALEKII